MRTTLFHIPTEVAGLPLFGVGLLLAVWIAVCIGRLGWIVYRRGWSAEVWNELPMMAVMAAFIVWVLPALAEPEGLPLRGYGVLVFLGVVAGVALAVYRAKQEGIAAEVIYALALWMAVAAIVGARAFYIFGHINEFHKPTLGATLGAIVNYTKGGLVVYGAFAGGVIAATIFFLRYKLPILKMADVVAPTLVLGLALGRLGCFLNGCCYGGQCDLPWAVTFPVGSPPYLDQTVRNQLVLHGIHFEQNAEGLAIIKLLDEDSPGAAAGLAPGDRLAAITVNLPDSQFPLKFPNDPSTGDQPLLTIAEAVTALTTIHEPGTKVEFRVIDSAGQRSIRTWKLTQPAHIPARSLPVHPTQLYSAIGALLLTLLLLAWTPFRRHEGEVAALLITIYPIMRILEESIRTDEPLIGRTGMTTSQNLSVLLLAAAVALWIFVLRGPRLKYGPASDEQRGRVATT